MNKAASCATPRSMVLPKIAPLALIAVASLALTAGYLRAVHTSSAGLTSDACATLEAEELSQPAPDFELPDLAGKKRRLSDLRGQVVVLNFWATWCPPCVEELPSLAQLAALGQEHGFAVLTVSVDESAAVVQDFLKKSPGPVQTLPVLMDPSKATPNAYGTQKFPETFLIDASGVARYKLIYKRDWASPEALACVSSLVQ